MIWKFAREIYHTGGPQGCFGVQGGQGGPGEDQGHPGEDRMGRREVGEGSWEGPGNWSVSLLRTVDLQIL